MSYKTAAEYLEANKHRFISTADGRMWIGDAIIMMDEYQRSLHRVSAGSDAEGSSSERSEENGTRDHSDPTAREGDAQQQDPEQRDQLNSR